MEPVCCKTCRRCRALLITVKTLVGPCLLARLQVLEKPNTTGEDVTVLLEPFLARRFIAGAWTHQAVQQARRTFLFSVVNLCSVILGMGPRASLLQITWLSHQSACCHGNTHTSVLLDGVEGLQRDTTWLR